MARLARRLVLALAVLAFALTAGPAVSTAPLAIALESPAPEAIVLKPEDLPPGFAPTTSPATRTVLPDGVARQAVCEFRNEGADLPVTVRQVVLRFEGRDAAEYLPRFADLMVRQQGYGPAGASDESAFNLARINGTERSVVAGRAIGNVLITTTVTGPTEAVPPSEAERYSNIAQARVPDLGPTLAIANRSAPAADDETVTLATNPPSPTNLIYPSNADGRSFLPVKDLPKPPAIDIIQPRPDGAPGEPEIAASLPIPSNATRTPDFPRNPKEYVSAVKPLLNQFWSRTFANLNRPYHPPEMLYVREGDQVPTLDNVIAERDLTAVGHVYLPELEVILISEPAIFSDLYATPDWKPRAYIVVTSMAHEWGHHMQNLLGVISAKSGIDDFAPEFQPLTSREVELQADCYAGLFTRYARDSGWLSDVDLAEAMAVRERVGDYLVDNPGHHGTPAQRREWFTRGFVHYSMKSCETW